jgi:hypothetical protein
MERGGRGSHTSRKARPAGHAVNHASCRAVWAVCPVAGGSWVKLNHGQARQASLADRRRNQQASPGPGTGAVPAPGSGGNEWTLHPPCKARRPFAQDSPIPLRLACSPSTTPRSTAAGSPPSRSRPSPSTGRAGLSSTWCVAGPACGRGVHPSPSARPRPPLNTRGCLAPTSAIAGHWWGSQREGVGSGGPRLLRQHPSRSTTPRGTRRRRSLTPATARRRVNPGRRLRLSRPPQDLGGCPEVAQPARGAGRQSVEVTS